MINRNLLDCWYENKQPIINISEAGMCDSICIKKLLDNFNYSSCNCLEYPNPQGEYGLLSELTKKYSCSYNNILVTNGASEALCLLMMVLCDYNSTITCQFPYYASNMDYLCRKIGATLNYEVFFDEIHQFDYSLFKARFIESNSDICILNVPNNPTNCVIEDEDYKRIIENVFPNRHVVFDETTYLSCQPSYMELNISNHFSNIIIINGMSKAFGLPGIRVGWIVADERIIASCLGMKELLSNSTSPLMQKIAAYILHNEGNIVKAHRSCIDNNWNYMSKHFIGAQRVFSPDRPPNNSAFCMLRVSNSLSDYQLCSDLYRDTGVLLAPSSCFNLPGFVRVGLGTNERLFSEALSIINNYCQKTL